VLRGEALGSRREIRLGLALGENLERDFSIEARIVRGVDDAHRACAEDVEDYVVRDGRVRGRERFVAVRFGEERARGERHGRAAFVALVHVVGDRALGVWVEAVLDEVRERALTGTGHRPMGRFLS
jgi:hypothetical protein